MLSKRKYLQLIQELGLYLKRDGAEKWFYSDDDRKLLIDLLRIAYDMADKANG